MSIELITVKTDDGIELDGALHQPDPTGRREPLAVLMIHGLTWNFYRGPSRWLPPILANAGYPCLSLNMRDHDQSEPKDFELAHYDLRAGIDYLYRHQDTDVIMLAHGYACNKAVCYPGFSRDQRVHHQILATLGAVKSYRPDVWETVMTQAPKLRGETLVVQGAIDQLIQARARADELKAAATGSRVETVLVEGANHYFDGCHDELANCVLDWIHRVRRDT